MASRFLEVRTSLTTATKNDLFTGDLNNLQGKQGIKENVTVFYLDQKSKQISGPFFTHSELDFLQLFTRQLFKLVGVITTTSHSDDTDFVFDMVLREATSYDLKETSKHLKVNQVYYLFDGQSITGPLYIDNSSTLMQIEDLLEKKQVFVPNERQHFKKRKMS